MSSNETLRAGCCVLTLGFTFAVGLPRNLPAQQVVPALLSTPFHTQAESWRAQNRPSLAQLPLTVQVQDEATSDVEAVQGPPSVSSKPPRDDRIFFALPNYLTVEKAAPLPPLTTREKFRTVAEGCFDPVEVTFIAIEAALGQADNTSPTFGQGFAGYSKRFGTAYADAIIGNFGTGAIFPALLRQDPRYYRRGKGSFLRRFMYAAGRVLVTRSDSTGKTQFNFSEFMGNAAAAGLANAYHPGPHTLASNADVLGTQIVLDGIGYELKEFWPDIHRRLLKFHDVR